MDERERAKLGFFVGRKDLRFTLALSLPKGMTIYELRKGISNIKCRILNLERKPPTIGAKSLAWGKAPGQRRVSIKSSNDRGDIDNGN
jgi:hypothetical protein